MENLKDIAYEQIKRRLLLCELMPGQRIKEKELQQEIGIGRTPVREALMSLEREGMVRILPRAGTFVNDIKMEEVLELYQLRKIIEPSTAIMVKNKIDSVHLLDLCDQLKSPPPDISAHLLDTEFHKYIVSCSGNMRLIEFFTTMMESVYRLDIYNTKVGHNNPRETTHAEHTCIAQAIIAGDDQLIRKAYFDHINNSQLASITALRKIKTEKINISIKSKGDAALYEKAY